MAKLVGLTRRGDTYHLRIMPPQDLTSACSGRAKIVKALGTSYRKPAVLHRTFSKHQKHETLMENSRTTFKVGRHHCPAATDIHFAPDDCPDGYGRTHMI